MALAKREPDKVTLTDYCQTNTASCIGEGAANAPVTIIEISDFGCPHCRDFHQQTWPAVCAETQVWAQLLRMSFPKRQKSRLLKGRKEGG
jgi:hypothetical protein